MQEVVTLECTEAKKEGKPASRYLTFRNKKTVTERIEKKKYNPHLKRHTLHKEIKRFPRYFTERVLSLLRRFSETDLLCGPVFFVTRNEAEAAD